MSYLSTEDPLFRNKLSDWLAELGEVSALIRFSASAGSKSFEFFPAMPAFLDRLAELPPRTCVIAFGTPQLPLRGRVDGKFARTALAHIPPESEYLIAGLELKTYGKVSWFGFSSGVGLTELYMDLADRIGESVAVGVYPPWEYDSDLVLSAIVPEPDGSIAVGIY